MGCLNIPGGLQKSSVTAKHNNTLCFLRDFPGVCIVERTFLLPSGKLHFTVFAPFSKVIYHMIGKFQIIIFFTVGYNIKVIHNWF